MAEECEEEPYMLAISLAMSGLQGTSNDFSGFLVSVYQGFLIRAEKILKQVFLSTSKSRNQISFKLSSSLLVLQELFKAVPDLHKKCIANEVARSGKGFLKNVFIAGSKLLECDGDDALISAIVEQYLVLSHWNQYSKDLAHEIGQSEVLIELLRVLEKLANSCNSKDELVTAAVTLLNMVKTCSNASSSLKSVKPFLISPNVKLRVATKVLLNCLHLHHKDVPVLLQKDELEFIVQKPLTSQDPDYPKADLLAFLVTSAHYAENRSVMLEGNVSEVLSDLIDTGTELEQTLAAELAQTMLSETSSAPVSFTPLPESPNQNNTSNLSPEVSAEDSQNCEEGSIEAVGILLHEAAKLMQAYISDPSCDQGVYMVAACVSLVWGLTKHSEVQAESGISDSIAQSPEHVSVCCDMLKYYPDMPPMPKAAISGILHQCLIQWTSFSQTLSEKLAESGMVLYLTGELEFLQSSMEMNEYVVMCLEMSLQILLNCVIVKRILPAFNFADSTTVLIPLASCTNLSIRVKVKSILVFLRSYMDEEDVKVLQLQSEEIAYIFQLATSTYNKASSDAPDSTDFNYWLKIMLNFGKIKENRALLSTDEMFRLILDVLTQRGELMQEHALQLLWELLGSEIAKRKIEDQHSVIMKRIEDLQSHPSSGLQSLALCILWSMGKSDPLDLPACLRYADSCYSHGKYEECSSWCDHISQHASKESALCHANLLKGKALYRSCEEKFGCLLKVKSTVSPEYELPKLMNDCLAKLKESISLLGAAHDLNVLDDDGSKLLDWAMIDFIREANKLDNCKRCLLCRRKTSLKRSHIYPRSVLKAIAEPNVSEGEYRVFLHELKGRLSAKSAGEITYWMLCSICELRLSQNGENEFRKYFFSPIFQASQLSAAEEDCLPSQNIQYGQWLYNFCVGILFRGLGVSIMPHCRNREEVYEAFVSYRKQILSIPVKAKELKQEEASVSDAQHVSVNQSKPCIPVAILINPTSTTFKGKPFLPATLLSSSGCALASLRLNDGQPTYILDAPFFLVRLGLINIIAEFQGTNSPALDNMYCIKPDGGVYHVPSENERCNSIPAGLWELFHQDADDSQEANIEYFLRLASDKHLLTYLLEDECNQTEPSSSEDISLLNDQSNVFEDGELTSSTDALQEQSSTTHMNLLPKGFSFFNQMGCLTYSSVSLPKGHRILLHATDPSTNITVFLCAGAGLEYSSNSPYLIILLSQRDAAIIDGVNLTPEGKIAGFVSDLKRRSGNVHPIRMQVMPSIQAAVEVLLPNMLIENGFESLEAVIHWTNCHWSLQEFPTLDSKCKRNGCWYCLSLCNVCMQPCKVGLSIHAPDDSLLKFCSEMCLAVMKEPGADGTTVPISVALPVHSDSHSLKHSETNHLMLQIYAKKLIDTHLAKCTLVEVSLFMEKSTKKLLVLQQLRTVDRKIVLGFSVSEELSITEPLACYMGNESTIASFEKVKQKGYTKLILEEALRLGLGFHDVRSLIH